jgi:hypothetical protein
MERHRRYLNLFSNNFCSRKLSLPPRLILSPRIYLWCEIKGLTIRKTAIDTQINYLNADVKNPRKFMNQNFENRSRDTG